MKVFEESLKSDLNRARTAWVGPTARPRGTGEHHSLALTDDGDVYAFGRADNNQLGLGDGVDHHTSPKEVTHHGLHTW